MSKLSKDEKRSIAMTVVVGITGYLVSMFTCEDVFPRFGAVIVCVGIFFATRGFTLRMDTFEPVAEEMKRNSIDDGLHLLESKRDEISDEQVDESKADFLKKAKKIDNEARRKIYRLKLRLLRVESSIVIAGTLIWAFGDWVVYGGYLSCTQ